MLNRFGSIGILMGGVSSERSVSLRSGQTIFEALSQAGFIVQAIDIVHEDKDKIAQHIKSCSIDIAFIALHGRLGEDGEIQTILDELEIPYTGSDVKSSRIAYNKILSQSAFKHAGLTIPKNYIIKDGSKVDFRMSWEVIRQTPLVVKSACEGSSIGVHIVRHPSEWETAIKDALKYGPFVIIEEYIKGREFTVGILEDTALPVVEIMPKTSFFSFNAKYQKGITTYACPAQISDDLTQLLQSTSLKAFQALGCSGFARVDLRVNENNTPYILEINTIPGFTETSLFPKAAHVAGITFLKVCEKLLELAYAKKRR